MYKREGFECVRVPVRWDQHMKHILTIFLITGNICFAQTPVRVDIDLTKGKKAISPFIYGKNNVLPSTFLSSGTTADITLAKEAGVRFVRQGGGNNSTKYNWRLKLSSHPDWYNNVYANNWDAAAKNLFDKMPGVDGMWSFQLLGKAAANTNNNFNDWAYNQSKWWEGVHQNLAGGGQPNTAGGSKALVEGNPDLYLMEWPADSTVKILDKWFGAKGLGYDKNLIRYWSMDIKLLDVLDIHYYPGSSDAATCLQFHRVFFDRNYVYPEANGVHTVTGGWDTSINKEYIFGRCSDWLTKYMGTGYGVGLAVTECGLNSKDANVQAVWYASTMGEFMKNGVEIFTPWSWDIGMWETLHLFTPILLKIRFILIFHFLKKA